MLKMCSYTNWPFVLIIKRSIQLPCSFIFFGLFGLLVCLLSLYILDIRLLSDEWLAKIISFSVNCHFILLIISFAVQSLLLWCNPIYQFTSYLLLLESFKYLPVPVTSSGSTLVSSSRFILSSFMFRYFH